MNELKTLDSKPPTSDLNTITCGETEKTKKSEDTFTVDDAVEKAGYGRFQIQLLVLAGLGWMADACEIFILSVIGNIIACDWTLYTWQIALLLSVVFGGMAVGSPTLGFIADIYGRKKALALSLCLVFIFGSVSAASPSIMWMVFFRAIMGFALGGISQGVTLCTEYCPPSMRGKAGFYLCYFWSIGTVTVILITWVVMVYLDNWRILLAVVSLPSFIVILLVKWYPESARFYLVSNQSGRAEVILKRMCKMNGTELPAGRLAHVENETRGRIKDLLTSKYRLTSLLIWYIGFASAFCYYGVVFVSPGIIKEGSLSNYNRISANGTQVNETSNLVLCSKYTQQDYINFLWTSASEFPGLFAATVLVERINRKALLSGACLISSILVILLVLELSKIVILLILFAARGIILSVFQLIFIVTSESYPTTFRAIALGFGASFCRVGGLIVPFVTQVLIVFSPLLAMGLMAVLIFLCGIAAAFLPFETRGARLREAPSLNS